MERFVQDVRFTGRRLLRRPFFAIVALLSLTIGIGANTAIFTLINAVIFEDVPVDRPEELVNIYKSMEGFSHGPVSYPDLKDLQDQAGEVFSDVGGMRFAFVQSDTDAGVEMLGGGLVTGNFFPMLGLEPAVGRTLLPTDDVSPGGHYVVMLGHSFWKRKYGSDPAVVGTDIRLNGRAYTIVGVAPAGYTGDIRGFDSDIYAPMMMVSQLNPGDQTELEQRGTQSVFAKGRLTAGSSLVAAAGVSARLTTLFQDQYPGNWQGSNELVLVPTQDVIMNPMIDRVLVPAAGMLLTVVALVLLIACANLASFLLAQAMDRRKEIALRLALGAGRGRLIRQLLTESLALATIGGVAGLLLAGWLLKVLQAADLPLPLPITLDLSFNTTVFVYCLAVTAGAGLFFGLIPAFQATNPDLAPTIKDEGTGGGKPPRITLRGFLVGGQVAASLVLLVGAGLFLRSLQARTSVDPGFGDQAAGLATIQLPADGYEPEEREVFFRRVIEEAGQLPGVTSVGAMLDLHLSTMNNMMMGITVDGVEPPPGSDFHLVDWSPVSRGLFEAIGVQIVEGRGFEPTDERDAPAVAVVSETMARQFWGDTPSAIGRTIWEGEDEYAVVGVATDAKVRSLGEAPRPYIYRSLDQSPSSFATVVAATRGDARRTAQDLLALIRGIDQQAIIYESNTMERHLAVMLLPHQLSALLVGVFGALALMLASIGLYGAVSYAVSSRTREVGIRLSLGAERGQVVRLLMSGGLRMVLAGGAAGLILAFVGARLLQGLLYGVSALDPVAFGFVPLVLGLVGVLAAWIPARRASVINPVRALKGD
ncbi:MAG: ABC transporter permease [Longimicrobiales bacterium]